MPRETGGQAFPHFYVWDRERREQIKVDDGMTLRDWFAGQALVGLLADRKMPIRGALEADHVAMEAGILADAMLAERAK